MRRISSIFSSNSKMKLIIKMCVLPFALLVFDKLVGIIGFSLINSSFQGTIGMLNYSIKRDVDIVIIGTSRASHHYIPEIICDNLDFKCLNLGIDGSNVISHLVQIKYIIDAYNPKLVIYDFIGQEFDEQMDNVARYDFMYPIIKNQTETLNILSKNDKFIKIKMMSNAFVFNSKAITILKNYYRRHSEVGDGYLPLYGSDLEKILKHEIKYFYNSENEREILVKAFSLTLSYLKKKNIPVIFIRSPQWNYLDGSDKYDLSKSLLKKNSGKQLSILVNI